MEASSVAAGRVAGQGSGASADGAVGHSAHDGALVRALVEEDEAQRDGSGRDDDDDDDDDDGPAVDEGGDAMPYAKTSGHAHGGLGLFTVGKPRPIEYKRDTTLPGGGFLSAAAADTLFKEQTQLCAQYLMEVGLDTQWYRDEVTGGGALKHITHMSAYSDFGQALDWSEEEQAMVLVRGDRNIYVPILDPKVNPAAFANDACFGLADAEKDPDRYDDIDAEQNSLEMIPCLSRGDDGKLWWSSVWLYPRADLEWKEREETELTFGYCWPLDPWMQQPGE